MKRTKLFDKYKFLMTKHLPQNEKRPLLKKGASNQQSSCWRCFCPYFMRKFVFCQGGFTGNGKNDRLHRRFQFILRHESQRVDTLLLAQPSEAVPEFAQEKPNSCKHQVFYRTSNKPTGQTPETVHLSGSLTYIKGFSHFLRQISIKPVVMHCM